MRSGVPVHYGQTVSPAVGAEALQARHDLAPNGRAAVAGLRGLLQPRVQQRGARRDALRRVALHRLPHQVLAVLGAGAYTRPLFSST